MFDDDEDDGGDTAIMEPDNLMMQFRRKDDYGGDLADQRTN